MWYKFDLNITKTFKLQKVEHHHLLPPCALNDVSGCNVSCVLNFILLDLFYIVTASANICHTCMSVNPFIVDVYVELLIEI